jgi:hypothetical protein
MNRMSKYILAIAVFLSSFQFASAFDPIKGAANHMSIQITNPLSGASKAGGMLEIRLTQSSFNLGYTQYLGVYAGKQYRFEYQKYIKTRLRNEYYWYLKAGGGTAQYDASKLEMLGNKTKAIIGPVDYYYAGAGVGRRFNLNHFVICLNAGLKYSKLPPDFSEENWQEYRLFYATGPGSILDLNAKFGYQF